MANYIKDILNMEYEAFIKLTEKGNFSNFQSVLKRMALTANRRIKKLESSEIGAYSPALKALKKAKIDKFSISEIMNATTKDTGKLIGKFSTMKKFLKAKSSRLGGWQAIRSQIRKRTGASKMFAKEYKTKGQARYWRGKEKKFWQLYNKLVDEYGGIISQLDSDRIQRMLQKIQQMKYKGKTDDMIQETMEKYIDDLYRAKEKGYKISDEDFENEVRLNFANSTRRTI